MDCPTELLLLIDGVEKSRIATISPGCAMPGIGLQHT
jgi:hypothetical protein